MARSNKYLKLHSDILLEWIYDTDNSISETYQVVQNLSTDRRGYISQSGLNRFSNTVFPVDEVIRKYAKLDGSKYNFLKFETYSTPYVQFDKLRIHIPTSYSFSDNGYIGLYLRVWTYDYNNRKVVDLCSYLYDDSDASTDTDISLNENFYYDEQIWGKYLSFGIPSVDTVSKQRTSTVSTNVPTNNSINYNLTRGIGLSQNSPIFIDFSFVISKQTILGNTYYFFSDKFTKSISPVPEYADLEVTIEESTSGDYFEIWGSYSESNESLDDFIDELIAKGRRIKIEYHVSRFEENILMDTQVFTVTENFSKKIKYRPIIEFSNTTAAIDVEMRVIDLVDESIISRYASIGLTNNLFKYGLKLMQIDLSDAFVPKIYNLKSTNKATGLSIDNNVPDINLTKVNFPVLYTSYPVKIKSKSTSSTSTKYDDYGNLELIFNKYDNIIRFEMASDENRNGTITPYDLTPMVENSNIYLSFKSDENTLEKPIWQQTDENDLENGIVIFKIDEKNDIPVLVKIGESDKKFSIIVRSDKTGVSTVLYTGTWVWETEVKFNVQPQAVDPSSLSTDGDISSETIPVSNTVALPTTPPTPTNFNALVTIEGNSNVTGFDSYLTSNAINVYRRFSCGNARSLSYLYLVTNINQQQFEDLKGRREISKVYEIPFNLGQGQTGEKITTPDNINNSTTRSR